MRLKEKRAINEDYKLMIVDDDRGIIDIVSDSLTRSGYDIRGFSSPLEGLEELKRNKYDLLILDYFMPHLKGDEFVAKLREFDLDLYVILLTGHTDLAPPLETIKALEIQAYCEKNPRLDQLMLLIESGIKSIRQMREIRKFRDGLNNILTSLPEVYQLKSIDSLLNIILTKVRAITKSTNTFIFVDESKKIKTSPDQVIYMGAGIFDIPVQTFIKSADAELFEALSRARTRCETVVTSAGIVLPLLHINDSSLGAIYVSGKVEPDNLKLLELFAHQAAISIHNATLHSMLDKKTDELSAAYHTMKSSYLETIEALRLAVDTKDVYTRGHSDRVSKYSAVIGKKLGMNTDDLETLRISGLFHDIGKIGLDNEILLKKGSLTDYEFQEIKKHPGQGMVIMSAVSAFTKAKDFVGSHHERIDGHGYPNGLTGNEIPFGAKIISVADAFDAMTSDRQYRRKMSYETAFEQLKRGRNTQFDKQIVDCFVKLDDDELKAVFEILDER